MLSRVADSVFWLGRYMERASGLLRILRTHYIASQDEVPDLSWMPLLKQFGDAAAVEGLQDASKDVVPHLLLDRYNGGSVINAVSQARENARSMQDHLPKEVWQCINDYYHLIRSETFEQSLQLGDPISTLDTLVQRSLLYQGTVDVTMARSEAFNFLNMGKFLERGMLSIDMLRIRLAELNYNLDPSADVTFMRYLLYSLSGYEQFLKQYRGGFEVASIVQHILYGESFPHSVLYCLRQIFRYGERLQVHSLPQSYAQIEYEIGRVLNEVKYSIDQARDGEALQHFLTQTRIGFADIGTSLNRHYFGHN